MHDVFMQHSSSLYVYILILYMQEDGWVVCRVFKKKNLFKVGGNNEGGGGSSSNNIINSEITRSSSTTTCHHHGHLNINTNAFNSNMQASSNQYHLIRQPSHNLMMQQPSTTSFELNNKPPTPLHHELAFHYPPPAYSHHPSLIPNAYDSTALNRMQQVKQLMITNAAARPDCESGSDYPPCEPALEVATAGQHVNISTTTTAGRDHHQDHDHDQAQAGITEWPTMLDRMVSPSAASAANNNDTLPSVSAHINHLSLRASTAGAGEMDFWGYAK